MESRFRSLTPHPNKPADSAYVDPLSLIDSEDTTTNKQLVLIHKELDKLKSDNRKKQFTIKKLKQDLQAAKRSTSVLTEDKFSLDQRLQRLENHLESVIQKRKEEEISLKSYQYLLDRIKEDKHALDKELKRQQLDLNKHQTTYHSELGKSKKLQEINLRERSEVQNLSQSLLIEKKTQNDYLLLVEKKALERSRAVTILEESSKHRDQIADAAQGQISNLETIELRNRILMSQMWYFYLNKRLQRELERGAILEAPFIKIKITTGMQSVEEILTRFLTREEAYKDLITAVAEAENTLKDLKNQLESSANHLKTLKTKEGHQSIEPHEEKIRSAKRSFFNFKDMKKKYKVLIKSLSEWGKMQLEPMGTSCEGLDLKETLRVLEEESQKIMEKVKEKKINSPGVLDEIMFLNTGQMINRNSFVKFFENNCRVVPRKMSATEEDSRLLIGKQ